MSAEEGIKRFQRLSRIQSMLFESPDGFTTRELSEEFSLTQRAIQRDLAELRLPPFNIPLTRDGLKWKVQDGYLPFLPPLLLNLPEAITVSLAMVEAWRFSEGKNPYVISSLVKLSNLLPGPVKEYVEGILKSLDEKNFDLSNTEVLDSLLVAWSTQRKIRIWCRSESEGVSCRYLLSPYFVEPHIPVYSMFVIGFVSPFNEVHALRLEHILRTELTDETYEIPSDFNATKWLESGLEEARTSMNYVVASRGNHEAIFPVFEQWHWKQDDVTCS